MKVSFFLLLLQLEIPTFPGMPFPHLKPFWSIPWLSGTKLSIYGSTNNYAKQCTSHVAAFLTVLKGFKGGFFL